MRRLLFLLALLAAPAQAATRMYLGEAPPPVFPAADSGWEVTTFQRWRNLMTSKGETDASNLNAWALFNVTVTTDDTINVSFVSAPMQAGVVFTSGSTTVSAQNMMREQALTDDVNECVIGLRVMSNDGTTTE